MFSGICLVSYSPIAWLSKSLHCLTETGGKVQAKAPKPSSSSGCQEREKTQLHSLKAGTDQHLPRDSIVHTLYNDTPRHHHLTTYLQTKPPGILEFQLKQVLRVGEKAHWLRALVALPEDLDLIPGTYRVAHRHL